MRVYCITATGNLARAPHRRGPFFTKTTVTAYQGTIRDSADISSASSQRPAVASWTNHHDDRRDRNPPQPLHHGHRDLWHHCCEHPNTDTSTGTLRLLGTTTNNVAVHL